MAKLDIDDDKVVAHLVKNTELLSKYIAILDDKSDYDFGGFTDFCTDEIPWLAKEVCHEVAYGSYGEFHVSVHEYQGIYFITAIEFDNICYFLDIKDAKEEAESFASYYPKSDYEDVDYC